MIVGGWNNSRNRNHPFPRVVDQKCLRTVLIDLPYKKPDCVSGSWNQLRPLLLKKLPLRIGAVTDCFQRYMESKTHSGLGLLVILTEANYPAQIVTKSDIIAEDEYINAMNGNKMNLLIQFSITSPFDEISRHLEPGAPPTSRRLQALARLVQKGFFTAVRINPLFPVYPDGTFASLKSKTNLQGLALYREAEKLSLKALPIFDLSLVNDILGIFETSPEETKGRHTLIAGFVRLPFASIKLVSQAIGWQPENLKKFFKTKKGNCYYYSPVEIRQYYEALHLTG